MDVSTLIKKKKEGAFIFKCSRLSMQDPDRLQCIVIGWQEVEKPAASPLTEFNLGKCTCVVWRKKLQRISTASRLKTAVPKAVNYPAFSQNILPSLSLHSLQPSNIPSSPLLVSFHRADIKQNYKQPIFLE